MSKFGTLDKTDWKKVGKGLLIAVAGAALTYATEFIPTVDWGSYTPVVVAGASVLINLAWKLLAENK